MAPKKRAQDLEAAGGSEKFERELGQPRFTVVRWPKGVDPSAKHFSFVEEMLTSLEQWDTGEVGMAVPGPMQDAVIADLRAIGFVTSKFSDTFVRAGWPTVPGRPSSSLDVLDRIMHVVGETGRWTWHVPAALAESVAETLQEMSFGVRVEAIGADLVELEVWSEKSEERIAGREADNLKGNVLILSRWTNNAQRVDATKNGERGSESNLSNEISSGVSDTSGMPKKNTEIIATVSKELLKAGNDPAAVARGIAALQKELAKSLVARKPSALSAALRAREGPAKGGRPPKYTDAELKRIVSGKVPATYEERRAAESALRVREHRRRKKQALG